MAAQHKWQVEIEPWSDLVRDCRPMMLKHWRELTAGAFGEWELDDVAARQMELAGMLVCASARSMATPDDSDVDSRKLLGYCIWYLGPNLARRGSVLATQGPWYVEDEWRKTRMAWDLFRKSMLHAAALGARDFVPHHWGGVAGPRLDRFFRSLGAKPLQQTYMLQLGDS